MQDKVQLSAMFKQITALLSFRLVLILVWSGSKPQFYTFL